nr:hypothetical protein B0A51_01423 [Rachicladosporium sp. CCFEE 5018]
MDAIRTVRAAIRRRLGVATQWLNTHTPKFLHFSIPSMSFILVHYLYLMSWSIIGSVMLFGPGGMDYIDSLFFAAGSSTQSGLNTIDVNLLFTYQQVVLMLIACLCNPVFINTVVVMVRLYWFEKRFKDIAEEARSQRRSFAKSRSMARSKSQAKDGGILEMGELEKGAEVVKQRDLEAERRRLAEKEGNEEESSGGSASSPPRESGSSAESSRDAAKRGHAEKEGVPVEDDHHLGLSKALANREITFADEVKKAPNGDYDDDDRLPSERDPAQHIAFVEKQKKAAKERESTLRIPGPRDFDRGEMPHQLDDSDDDELVRPQTRNTLRHTISGFSRRSSMSQQEKLNDDDHPVRRGITFNEPQGRVRGNTDATAPGAENEDDEKASTLRGFAHHLRHRRTRSNGTEIPDRKSTWARTIGSITTLKDKGDLPTAIPYLSWQPTIGRNSAFVGLTSEQREELGGIEYRALKMLAKILVGYFVGFHLLGMIVLLPWIIRTPPWNSIPATDGFNPTWWGIFTPASMFNDLGYTLTPDSMISFQTATVPLLFGSYLIVIGNTGFPCMLRCTIWILSKFVRRNTPAWEELKFLLDHPRRCFTLLFPSKATWWLFGILVMLNGLDLLLFIILDLNDETVMSIAPRYRILSGWFQAVSTRTAGFACVNLADLHPAVQVSYLVMMYISVFPIAISVRRTNVYEEKSLGIWGGEEEASGEGEQSYVGQHLRRQLSFDLWYVFLGFFIMCIVEGDRLANTNQYAFTMFSVLFEVVSAYGTVGLSLGYPGINASFSTEFRVISKLVIVAMMIRGRHRGLPYALDRAILLPSEHLHKKEAEDADRRHERRNTFTAAELEHDTAGLRRRRTAGDALSLDEEGLPRQHTGMDGMGDPMLAGAGGVRRETGMQRRGSGYSTVSQFERRKHERGKSLASFVAGGLGAGPTWAKDDFKD